MGITADDISLIQRALEVRPDIKNVMELGSQNLYTHVGSHPPFANILYESLGIEYSCIDLAGDNNALKFDLSHPITPPKQFDLVTDFGTSEHVVQANGHTTVAYEEGYINSVYPQEVKDKLMGYYNCWCNKHKLLKVGGVMINVNPASGSWPGHGFHYLRMDFYLSLRQITNYFIEYLDQKPAMGNTKDGWNIVCILVKQTETFPTFEEFKRLPIYDS